MYQLRHAIEATESWGGYPLVTTPESFWVNATSNWLGYLNIDGESRGYIFESDLWVYIAAAPEAAASGAWVYVIKR